MQVPRLALPKDLRGNPRACSQALTSPPPGARLEPPLKCPLIFYLLFGARPLPPPPPPEVSLQCGVFMVSLSQLL